jgi:1-acyl-sn-glycerol-3-phosphate acyltransferase
MIWFLSGYWITGSWRKNRWNRAFRARRKWVKATLKALGVKVDVEGEIPQMQAIYASSHKTFLDPVFFLNVKDAFPVAKAEISRYPLVGMAASHTGIIFVDRRKAKSREHTRQTMKLRIQQGFSILIFPEGTVYSGQKTKTFAKGGFEIAAAMGIPVIPVAIRYSDPRMFWKPDQSLWQHFRELLKVSKPQVALHIGPQLESGRPFTLLRESKHWIDEVLSAL